MSGVKRLQYVHLVHEGFRKDAEELAKRGKDYTASLLKQLEKLQVDPFGACDRYDCDALPSEYEDYVRKCDIKGKHGPKVFTLICRDNRSIWPFFITKHVRSSIDYDVLQPRIEASAKRIIEVIETWPERASECEIWLVGNGQKQTIGAVEALEKYGQI